ncbi:hypothetical protein [Pseudomonas phage vB_PaeM_PAO1_Ab17]|uniref:Uncharacterized protein n=4 Tax=Nankokuvirus TaxID=1925779 RepID=A0A0A1IV00_9CAUD|nr:hypothetical protein VC54_gp032 [Pseudomonas phage vB_PaeM_PAO1_Ab03]CEF89137.1 hypothetical protein [Pseudomonas phage vB_PaeM_PAO1_Ab03]CEF89521.1 hypothetical protein [Pseudomonas phage vB_PaeM_PAO1_Ab17]CEQ38309.1 hypothetical protein [Pseudomonas phage vB_PaeM_PAO1_Ab04]
MSTLTVDLYTDHADGPQFEPSWIVLSGNLKRDTLKLFNLVSDRAARLGPASYVHLSHLDSQANRNKEVRTYLDALQQDVLSIHIQETQMSNKHDPFTVSVTSIHGGGVGWKINGVITCTREMDKDMAVLFEELERRRYLPQPDTKETPEEGYPANQVLLSPMETQNGFQRLHIAEMERQANTLLVQGKEAE